MNFTSKKKKKKIQNQVLYFRQHLSIRQTPKYASLYLTLWPLNSRYKNFVSSDSRLQTSTLQSETTFHFLSKVISLASASWRLAQSSVFNCSQKRVFLLLLLIVTCATCALFVFLLTEGMPITLLDSVKALTNMSIGWKYIYVILVRAHVKWPINKFQSIAYKHGCYLHNQNRLQFYCEITLARNKSTEIDWALIRKKLLN